MTVDIEEGRRPAEIRIASPLPFDIAGTLLQAIGAAYPNAALKQSAYGEAMVVEVPEGDRPGMVAGVKPIEVLGIGPDGLGITTPEELANLLHLWAESLFDQFPDAENYIEQKGVAGDRHYVFTFRRAQGKTPHELRQAAEAERDALQARLDAVRALHGERRKTMEIAWTPIPTSDLIEPRERTLCGECGKTYPCPTLKAIEVKP